MSQVVIQQGVDKASRILERRRMRLGQTAERRALSRYSFHPISFAVICESEVKGRMQAIWKKLTRIAM